MNFTKKLSNCTPYLLIFIAGFGFSGLSLASLQKISNRQERQFCSTSVAPRVLLESRSTVGTVYQCFPTPQVISKFEFNFDHDDF
jgi:hypothetical protein